MAGARVVAVVPWGLQPAAVAPDTGPGGPSYCMDAAAMSLGLHGCGIHAVWSGAAEAGVTKVRFRWMPQPIARREARGAHTKINSS
jgi:hypothetical protein